jgi:iron complex outermembrane recepter protein
LQQINFTDWTQGKRSAILPLPRSREGNESPHQATVLVKPEWEGGRVGCPEPEDLFESEINQAIFRGGKMERSCSNLIFISFVVFIFCSIYPRYSFGTDQPGQLEEIVVTASRYEEKLTNVPANITVINEERISNSTAQNIPELLRSEAGVSVSDIAGNRRYYNVDLRGFGETGALNTLVLVDGIRMNQPDLSGTDWALIPLDRIQRIEIIRGGRGAVLYGDNATGGVINIITKDGGDKMRAGGEVAAGSYNTYSIKAFASGSPVATMPLYVSGSYLRTDGYRDNSGLNMKDVGLNVNYIGIKNLRINFATGYHQDSNRLPGALKESDFNTGRTRTDTTHPDDYARIEDYYFRVTPEYFITDNASLKMDMSYRRRTNASYSSGDYWNFLGVSGIQTVALSPRASIKNELTKDISNSLVTGADYQWAQEDIRNRSDFFGSVSTGEYRLHKTNYGVYIHDELAISRRLFLSAGYRWDQADFTFSPSSPDSSTMRTHAWTVGANYKYFNKSYAYLTYSRSFRYPALDEFYSFYNNTINTSMRTQTSDSYEIGTRFYFSDNIYTHLNLFRSDTSNEIFYNPITYSNENLEGTARRTGVEVSFSAKVIDSLIVRGNYTYINSEIRGGEFTGKQIPNVPEHKAGLEGQYSPFKGFTVVLNGTYVGERRFISDFSNDYARQKDYFLVNNKYSYKWKNYTVFLNINNLLNQKYSEYGVIGGYPAEKAYYPSPGINCYGGLRVEI